MKFNSLLGSDPIQWHDVIKIGKKYVGCILDLILGMASADLFFEYCF